VALVAMSKLQGHVGELADNLLPSTSALDEAQVGFLQVRLATSRAIITGLRENFSDALKQRPVRDQAFKDLEEGLKAYAALPMSDQEKAWTKELEAGIKYFGEENPKVWQAIENRDATEASAIQNGYVDEVQRRLAAAKDFITCQGCDERVQLIAYSTPSWTPIPRQTGHPVQRKLDSDSRANWTPVPGQTGHLR